MPLYDEKYIKTKVEQFDGVTKTNFLGDEAPKENGHYPFMDCITIDSIMRMEKKNYRTSLFRRMRIQNEKDKNEQIHRS